MAQKRRFLDVWLVEANAVYREVPFTVVADWVQQSRLLPDDMLRPSGTKEWFKVGESPDFLPYVPRAEPDRVEDQAEALDAVQMDFAWKRPHEEEDEDVDMIPLIDVSLVLLIFFILTTTGAAAAWFIDTPAARNGFVTGNPKLLWVGVNLDRETSEPVYSVGLGDAGPAGDEDRDIRTLPDLLARLDHHLGTIEGPAEVTIKANKNVESGVVRELTAQLARRPQVWRKFISVSEKQ